MMSVIKSYWPSDLQMQVSICGTTSTLFEIELWFSHLFFLASEFYLNFNPIVHKMAKLTLKVLQHLLQDF